MPRSTLPPVHYAVTADGLNIAYSMAGDGPPLIFVRGLNSHAQEVWDDAYRRPYLTALTHAFTVVAFDARGNGMSDPVEAIDLEGLVEDVRAVAGDLELDTFTLYGQGFGAPIAVAFSALEGNRVDRLILYCAYLRGRDVYIPDFFMEAMKENPQAATAMMGHASYPDTRRLSRRFLTPAGLSATPETALLYFELARSVDVSEFAPTIKTQTLVMQPDANQIIPLELGKEVASAIPEARFEPVSSGSYNPWAQEAVEPTLTAISDFIGSGIPLMPAPRPMAVLVTDLVGSTEMTHRLGEERARDLLRAHDDIVRSASRKFGGQEVKHTGDGMMVRFDDPGEAVAGAVSIQERLVDRNESVSDDPLHVRVGIAYGDVVEEHDGLFGMTVVLAVRIMDQADAGQILVSESVCASVEDRYDFSPATPMELKGFPDAVPVFELLNA